MVQWNPVNTDTEGECPNVRIIGVSVLSGFSDKTLRTHVLSKKRPWQTFYNDYKRFNQGGRAARPGTEFP